MLSSFSKNIRNDNSLFQHMMDNDILIKIYENNMFYQIIHLPTSIYSLVEREKYESKPLFFVCNFIDRVDKFKHS